MVPDANLQVWLDTQSTSNQTVLIPYVKSVNEMQLNYRIELVQQGGGSVSRISQQGQVNVAAAQPTALGRVALGSRQGGECRIELALSNRANSTALGTYQFDCPR